MQHIFRQVMQGLDFIDEITLAQFIGVLGMFEEDFCKPEDVEDQSLSTLEQVRSNELYIKMIKDLVEKIEGIIVEKGEEDEMA